MEQEKAFYQRLAEKGVSRRDFMKYCTFLTATMGLSSSFVPKVAEVFAAPKQRTPVIWLHFAECTGCSEAVLRSQYPYVDELVLEVLSIEYHETIMAAAGQQAEDQLHMAMKKYKGDYICVVEGAIATNFDGGYGKEDSDLRNRMRNAGARGISLWHRAFVAHLARDVVTRAGARERPPSDLSRAGAQLVRARVGLGSHAGGMAAEEKP